VLEKSINVNDLKSLPCAKGEHKSRGKKCVPPCVFTNTMAWREKKREGTRFKHSVSYQKCETSRNGKNCNPPAKNLMRICIISRLVKMHDHVRENNTILVPDQPLMVSQR